MSARTSSESGRSPGLALLRRIPVSARVGVALALALLAVFVGLLLVTASARRAGRRELASSLVNRLYQRGVDVSVPYKPATCRPQLTYRLICAVGIAAGGSARFDLRYGDGGCWTARLLSAPAFDLPLPIHLAGCAY